MPKNRPTPNLINARREAHLRTVPALSLLVYIARRAPHELAAWPWIRHWVAEATSRRIPTWFTSNPRLAALAQGARFFRVPVADLCAGLERPIHPRPHDSDLNDALLLTVIRHVAFAPLLDRGVEGRQIRQWSNLNPRLSDVIQAAYIQGRPVESILEEAETRAAGTKKSPGQGFGSVRTHAQNPDGGQFIPCGVPSCPV